MRSWSVDCACKISDVGESPYFKVMTLGLNIINDQNGITLNYTHLISGEKGNLANSLLIRTLSILGKSESLNSQSTGPEEFLEIYFSLI